MSTNTAYTTARPRARAKVATQQSSCAASSSRKIVSCSFLSGGIAPAETSGRNSSCSGCLHHPSLLCATCGAPATYALPADELHSLSLCKQCAAVAYSLYAEAQEERRQVLAAMERNAGKRGLVGKRGAAA